jgi:hypothetical protein
MHIHNSGSKLKGYLAQKRNRREKNFIDDNLLKYLYSGTVLVHLHACCHLNRRNFTTDAVTDPIQLFNIHHTSF